MRFGSEMVRVNSRNLIWMKKYILGFGVVLKAKVHIFSIVPSPYPPPPHSSFLPLWSFLKMIWNCFIPVLYGHWSDHVLGW